MNRRILVEETKIWFVRLYGLLCRFSNPQKILDGVGENLVFHLGNKHVLVAEGLCVLGELSCWRGRYTDAQKIIARAIISQKIYLVVKTQELFHAYLDVMRRIGNLVAASESCKNALNIRLNIFGKKKSTICLVDL